MSPRALLCVSIVLLAPAIATAQVASGEGLTTVGPGGTYDGLSDQAFTSAIGHLSSTGGTILVLPGDYTFGATVTVPDMAPGITIRGTRGATLRAAHTGLVSLFDVRTQRFALESLRVEILASELLLPPDGLDRAAIRYEALGPLDLRIENCILHMDEGAQSGTAPGFPYVLVDVVGDEATPPRGSVLVQGNAFAFAEAPDGTVTRPSGVVALRASQLSGGVRVIGNSFTSTHTETRLAQGWLRRAVQLEEVETVLIASNTFVGLGRLSSRLEGVVTILNPAPAQTAVNYQTSITGNYFELVVAEASLLVEGAGFHTIVGNGFGRSISGAGGGIEDCTDPLIPQSTALGSTTTVPLGTPGGPPPAGDDGPKEPETCTPRGILIRDGSGVVICGNQFHKQGSQVTTGEQQTWAAIEIENNDGALITGNNFTLAAHMQIVVRDGASRVQLVGNHFAVEGTADPTDPPSRTVSSAVQVRRASGCMVSNNISFDGSDVAWSAPVGLLFPEGNLGVFNVGWSDIRPEGGVLR